MGNLNAATQGDAVICSVDADASAYTFVGQAIGCTALTRNSIGDYTITTTESWDFVNCNVQATLRSGTLGAIAIEVVDATHLRVKTATLAVTPTIALADIDFWLRVTPLAPN